MPNSTKEEARMWEPDNAIERADAAIDLLKRAQQIDPEAWAAPMVDGLKNLRSASVWAAYNESVSLSSTPGDAR